MQISSENRFIQGDGFSAKSRIFNFRVKRSADCYNGIRDITPTYFNGANFSLFMQVCDKIVQVTPMTKTVGSVSFIASVQFVKNPPPGQIWQTCEYGPESGYLHFWIFGF